MFAKFDEIPAMTLQDIKETKRYRRTDGKCGNSIPSTNKVCKGIKNPNVNSAKHYGKSIKQLAKI